MKAYLTQAHSLPVHIVFKRGTRERFITFESAIRLRDSLNKVLSLAEKQGRLSNQTVEPTKDNPSIRECDKYHTQKSPLRGDR